VSTETTGSPAFRKAVAWVLMCTEIGLLAEVMGLPGRETRLLALLPIHLFGPLRSHPLVPAALSNADVSSGGQERARIARP
jgi:hypothetical protein